MKKIKKIVKRGEVEDHFEKVNKINSPFRSQQITGSPYHIMSEYLPKYANKPKERYIIISGRTGKKLVVGVGEERKVPGEIVDDTIARAIKKSTLKDKVFIHLHNHPSGYPTPSLADDSHFRTVNILSRYKDRNYPDKSGVISKNFAMIYTYPNPFEDDKLLPINKLIDHDISSGKITLKSKCNFMTDDDNIRAFDDYRKIHGIEKETIEFDKPLYMARKKKSTKINIKMPSIKIPILKLKKKRKN